MPRREGTQTITMGFHPEDIWVKRLMEQAKGKNLSLSLYIRQLIIDLTADGVFLPLRFKNQSKVLQSLEQEARSLDVDLAMYVEMILSDRYRALYSDGQQKTLWFPKGKLVEDVANPVEVKQSQLDAEEAQKVIANLASFYNEDM